MTPTRTKQSEALLQRFEKRLAHVRAPLWLGLLAVVLCLPALRHGLQADDLLFPWKLEQGTPAWTLFQMEAENAPRARAEGFLVWWASPHLQAKFFRPLASLTHALDFTLWPHAAWLMRAFNALIYGAVALLAARLYRRFAPALSTAGLAGLLFALDDGHAFSAGWISGRNTLLALLFALLALELHVRARELSFRSRASTRAALYAASALSVALALASAEAGVWALSLLVSYALVMEQGRWYVRLRSISAALLVAVAWAALYVALDCGLRGSSFYRDPSAPVSAFTQGVLDLPVWFADLFGAGGFPFSLMYPPLWVRLGMLPVALTLLWLLWPALRSSRACRFFALASALCIVPLMCTLPTSRVLLGPSFGAMGWIACSIMNGRADGRARGRWSARILLTLHVGLAALLFVPWLGGTQAFAYGSTALAQATKPGRDVIVLQTPVELLSNYALLELTTNARAHRAPRSLHQLYTGSSELSVERMDARTLDVVAARGWGHAPIERIFCAPEDMPRAGSEVRLPAFTAHVLESHGDGMPKRVRFVFPTPLEAPERQWLTWEKNRPVTWTPPAVGERVGLPPLSFFQALSP